MTILAEIVELESCKNKSNSKFWKIFEKNSPYIHSTPKCAGLYVFIFFKKLFLAEFDLFLHASPIFSGFGYFFPSSITKSCIQSLKPPFWFFWNHKLTGNRFMSFSKYSVHDLVAKTGSQVGERGKIQFSK